MDGGAVLLIWNGPVKCECGIAVVGVGVHPFRGASPARFRACSYYSVAGTVITTDTQAGRASVEELSLKYTGQPYRPYAAGNQTRVLLTIRVDRILHAPWH